MAVKIKSGNLDYLKKIGVGFTVIQALKHHGIKIVFSAGAGLLTFTTPDGQYELGQMTSETADNAVAVTEYITGYVIPKINGITDGSVPLDSLAKAKKKPATNLPDWGMGVPVEVLKNKAPVELRNATHMYQRVRGSSADSTYYVVAMNEGVKLAVKMKGSGISIRAEGDALASNLLITALAKAKMGLKQDSSGKKYSSAHLTCDDNCPPSHLIGSLLTAMEIEFTTPFPSVTKLKKLCS